MQHRCNYCTAHCIKKGIRNGKQKYYCKSCSKYQQQTYSYTKANLTIKNNIINLTKEGMSMSSIARYLKLSKTTIQRTIKILASTITKPVYIEKAQCYELDEMTIKIAGRKDVYLIYAINRETRNIIDFCIGNRTKLNIKNVINTVLNYSPKKIYTDGLNSYPSIIPSSIHTAGRHITNRIERKNLTLRNHIKRLSRGTLCFSRSETMLSAVLKIVSWV